MPYSGCAEAFFNWPSAALIFACDALNAHWSTWELKVMRGNFKRCVNYQIWAQRLQKAVGQCLDFGVVHS